VASATDEGALAAATEALVAATSNLLRAARSPREACLLVGSWVILNDGLARDMSAGIEASIASSYALREARSARQYVSRARFSAKKGGDAIVLCLERYAYASRRLEEIVHDLPLRD
jgi:hypothetical protein